MSGQRDVYSMGATRYSVGTSQILRLAPLPGAAMSVLKYISGGSLEIVNPVLSGASTAAASGWGAGYLMGTTETMPIYGPAVFYLAASGATCVVALATGFSAGGATLL